MPDEPYIAEIMIAPFTFAPKGWAFCNGQLLPINQNQALFSLVGTQFGGDGRVTFGLPDLRGRLAMNESGSYLVGQTGGSETVTLQLNEMPPHIHPVTNSTLTAAAPACHPGAADTRTPTGNAFATEASGVTAVYGTVPDALMGADSVHVDGTGAVSPTGGSLPHTNVQPYLALNFCICLQGVFPSRS